MRVADAAADLHAVGGGRGEGDRAENMPFGMSSDTSFSAFTPLP
jgi:hypothetical protein